MSNINLGGGYSSSPQASQHWTLRDRLRNLTTALSGGASLDLRFINQYFYKADQGGDPNQYAALELLDATCTRGSKGWYPEWDFTNGGVCGRLTEYANNAIRYGSQGLLEEASSTNQIRNPRCEGAEAPSTFPTNWGVSGANVTIVGSGYENGWPYVDVRWNPSGAQGNFGFQLEQLEQVPASSGQSWTLSFGARVVAGSMANLVLQTRLRAWNAGVSNWDYTGDAFPGTPDGAHKRFVQTGTITGTATSLVPFIFMDSTGAADVTLRIYAPQLEQASAPSSPILPVIGTPAATTRATETVNGLTTVSRDSRKSNAGEWDFTNGGSVGAFREYLPDVPAVTGKGLLVEEATTNQIRNPRCEGAVAGTPGTAPTNWSVGAVATTTSVVDSGYENGWPYVDVRFNGTPIGAPQVVFDAINQITAATGQTWSFSAGVKLVAGSLANINGIAVVLVEEASGGSLVNNNVSPAYALDGSHRRITYTATFAGGGTVVSVRPRVQLAWDGSGAIDITLRIYAPQLEQKAYPTSPILPPKGNPGAATRAADDIEVGNGAWSNANAAGTLYIEAVLNNRGAASNFGTIGAAYGADVSNDYIRFRAAGSGGFNVVAEDGNTVVVSTIGSQTVSEPAHAVYGAVAWDTDDVAASVRGETQTFDTSATVGFGAAKLIFAEGSSSTTFPSQYIKQLRYFPRRLSNAELETLVGN